MTVGTSGILEVKTWLKVQIEKQWCIFKYSDKPSEEKQLNAGFLQTEWKKKKLLLN